MDDRKTVFWCEDTVDGIFTAVYEAWASRLGLANVTVQTRAGQNMSLFASYRQVETDHEKAARVAETIRRNLGWEDYQVIYQAALADDPRNLQEPAVMKTFELSRRVENEAHRYRMFVRFRELEGSQRDSLGQDGLEVAGASSSLMFSEIEPENRILAVLGDHFADRFPMMNFAIYDRTHRECLVHPAGKRWAVLEDMELDEDLICRYSRQEQEFSRLWKGFVKSIAIEERRNPRCQMNFMPKKYWKHMTEHEL